MKKLYAGLVIGIFLISTFLAINLYNSTSFPGYGTNAPCNECHNQPAFIKNVDVSFNMNNHTQSANAFSNNQQWATDEVPTIPTNNRSDSNIEFVTMTFLKNSTDIMVRAQVSDSNYNASSSTTSDKFGIIFNIDVANFTVGDFLTNYNATATNLDNVLTGQMAFPNGHADFWYVDMSKIPVNTSSMAADDYIAGGINSDGTSHQDVHVTAWYGAYGHGNSMEYDYYFVRALNTNDPNDVQFTNDGVGVHYAIAHWEASSATYHISSFDQMVIVGDSVGAVINTVGTTTVNNNFTTTYSEPASIGSTVTTFTVVIVLALIAVALPIIAYFYKPRK